jgi:hypothetical protein
MMELTTGNCRRDSHRLQSSVANAINDIQQISNLQITDTIETNFLQDYLPKVDIDSSVNNIGTIRQKRSIPIFANFINWLTKADEFWSLLDIQYRQNKTVFFHHDPNQKPSQLLTNFYETYLQVINKAPTQMPFHLWLTKRLKRASISYETNGDINRYKSQTPFFPNVLKTNDINSVTNHRHKRSIGTAFAIGIPVIGVASIAVKSLIDSIMLPEYFASKQDMLINAQRIEELRLGHNDISKAVHEVNNRLASIGAKFDLVIASTAIATMESDLKSLIQYLETALQITLLKYEAALAAAQNSRTSPYTLTQTELIKLVSETHLKTRHTIDSNINHARTTAIIVNNTLSFIIEIPLLDDDKFFNFYSVKAVPTFYKNTTLYPDIETNNIAISADGNKYVVLDQTELDRCMDTPSICNSHSPIQPFSNQALCVVTTYSSNSPTCPLKTFHTQPFVFLHFDRFNHKMFYSAPNHSNVFVRCAKGDGTIEDHNYQIFGIGTAKFRPDCQINLNDGTTYKTPLAIATKQISNLPILDIKSLTPGAHDYDPKNSFKINQTDTYVAPISPHLHNNAMKQSFDVYSILSLIVGTAVPIIVAALVRACCLEQFKRCCLRKIGETRNSQSDIPARELFPYGNSIPRKQDHSQTAASFPDDPLDNPANLKLVFNKLSADHRDPLLDGPISFPVRK